MQCMVDEREGGGGVADKGVGGGFNYCKNLNNMSSKCITDLNH